MHEMWIHSNIFSILEPKIQSRTHTVFGFQFQAIPRSTMEFVEPKKKNNSQPHPKNRICYWKFLIYFPSIHTNRELSSRIFMQCTHFSSGRYLLSYHVFRKDINRWIFSHSHTLLPPLSLISTHHIPFYNTRSLTLYTCNITMSRM